MQNKVEVKDAANEDAAIYRINNNNITSKIFDYITLKHFVPLKYLNNFWRFAFNCQIELDLSCSRYFISSEISRIAAVAANPPNPAKEAIKKESETFMYSVLNVMPQC